MYRAPKDENANAMLEFELTKLLEGRPVDRPIVMDELLAKLGLRAGNRRQEMYIGARLRGHGFERVKQRVDGVPRMVWRRR
jgi:hypothetical protein